MSIVSSIACPSLWLNSIWRRNRASDGPIGGADYGPVSSKKIMIFGYKLHMLITLGGLIIDFELAPASEFDLAVGCELLSGHRNRIVIGDKAYVSAPAAEDLWHYNRICLLTKRRKNQKKQLTKHIRRLYDSIRQMIETVTSQLEAQFLD